MAVVSTSVRGSEIVAPFLDDIPRRWQWKRPPSRAEKTSYGCEKVRWFLVHLECRRHHSSSTASSWLQILLRKEEQRSVSFLKNIEFPDALFGSPVPSGDWGPATLDKETAGAFENAIAACHMRVQETWGELPKETGALVARIEEIVQEMWSSGWTAEEKNLSLFVMDFGTLLASALLRIESSVPIIRVADEGIHSSVMFAGAQAEIFPWHKLHRRLIHNDGEGLPYFFWAVVARVGAT